MRLIVPYVRNGLAEPVRQLGIQHRAEFYDLTGDDNAYHLLLRRIWSQGESFTIVEQDVSPTTAILDAMWGCPHEWCAATLLLHPLATVPAWSLACVKFAASLLKREPDMLTSGQLAEPVHWVVLDTRLLHLNLTNAGYLPHLHEPPIRHLRVEAARGAYPMLAAWRSRM